MWPWVHPNVFIFCLMFFFKLNTIATCSDNKSLLISSMGLFQPLEPKLSPFACPQKPLFDLFSSTKPSFGFSEIRQRTCIKIIFAPTNVTRQDFDLNRETVVYNFDLILSWWPTFVLKIDITNQNKFFKMVFSAVLTTSITWCISSPPFYQIDIDMLLVMLLR